MYVCTMGEHVLSENVSVQSFKNYCSKIVNAMCMYMHVYICIIMLVIEVMVPRDYV